MKTLSPLLLCLCAVLMATPQIALADDTTPSQTAPSDGSGAGADNAQKLQRWKNAFAQLGLTDDQKAQIRQIRQTVTDPAQRHQQVMAVLTPDQKQKLKDLLQQVRANGGLGGAGGAGNGGAGGSGAGAATSGTGGMTHNGGPGGAGDGSDLAPGAN